VYRRDDRLGAVEHVVDEVPRLPHHPRPGLEVAAHLLDQLERAARGEALALAPEQHGPHLGVGVELAPDLGQVAVRALADRVQLRRIEHQLDDPRLVRLVDAQMREACVAPHGVPPSALAFDDDYSTLYIKF
jgi:hypothetical protein